MNDNCQKLESKLSEIQAREYIKREGEEEFETLFLAPPAENLLALSADLQTIALSSYNENVKGLNPGLIS